MPASRRHPRGPGSKEKPGGDALAAMPPEAKTMRIRWRNFELPNRVTVDPATRSSSYGAFAAEPFERGFGTTIGNGLRRILLGSLEGTAVTHVKIAGVPHEFTAMEGVVEDVTEILLNLKRLLVKLEGEYIAILRLNRSGKGEVLAGDFKTPHSAEIVNPDLKILTLASDRELDMEVTIRTNRGYRTAEENAGEDDEIGLIPVDSIFSPVQRVRYRTENTRVGKMTNYDRLILEITEREIMEDHRAIVEVLEAFHRQGVRISIDDFGTGFSSLTHLRKLPIHEIKIDQSFISGMLDRENDYIIARSIIDLAHNLGHRVVAEGVEDTVTLELLRGLGCDIAQGFLFARPGPPERIRRQIESGPALDPDGSLVWNTHS